MEEPDQPRLSTQVSQETSLGLDKMRAIINAEDYCVLKTLYELLNIIDGKASSLLTLNAITVAILAIIAQGEISPSDPSSSHPHNSVLIPLALGTLTIAVSAFFCFTIMNIAWKFFGHVTLANGQQALGTEIAELCRLLDDRAGKYTWAWIWACEGGILTLISAIVWSLHCRI